MVDEDAIAVGGPEERHVLVGLFTARAAVGVPDVHRLAVLDDRAEPLAESVHELAHAEGQLLEDERRPVRIPCEADRSRQAAGQPPPVVIEVDPQRLAGHAGRQAARFEGRHRCLRIDRHRRQSGSGKLERGSAVRTAGVAVDPNAEHSRQWRADGDRRRRSVERVAARTDPAGRRQDRERRSARRGVARPDLVGLGRTVEREAVPNHPVPVSEFHAGSTFSLDQGARPARPGGERERVGATWVTADPRRRRRVWPSAIDRTGGS